MIDYVSSTVEHIRRELGKIIVGQHEPIEQILVALLAEGHALIEGVPGTAKTLTVKTLSTRPNLYRHPACRRNQSHPAQDAGSVARSDGRTAGNH